MKTPSLVFSSPVLGDSECNDANSRWAKVVAMLVLAVICLAMAHAARFYNMERERRESSTMSRLLLSFHDTKTGIIEVRGISHEISSASKEACEIFGYRPEELNGQNISIVIPDSLKMAHQQKVSESMRAVMGDPVPKNRPPVSKMRCIGLRKDGSEVPISIHVSVSVNGIFALVNRLEDVSQIDMMKNQ